MRVHCAEPTPELYQYWWWWYSRRAIDSCWWHVCLLFDINLDAGWSGDSATHPAPDGGQWLLSRHHHCQHRSSGHLLHHTCTWAADLQSLGPRHLWKCHVQLGPEGEDTDAFNFIWYSMSIPINAIWQCLEIYLLPFNVTHEGSGQDIASEIFSSLIHLSDLHKSCS